MWGRGCPSVSFRMSAWVASGPWLGCQRTLCVGLWNDFITMDVRGQGHGPALLSLCHGLRASARAVLSPEPQERGADREESCEDLLSVCPAMRSSTNAPSVPTYRSHPCSLPSLFPSPGSRAQLCSPLAEGRLQVGEPRIIRGAPLLPPGPPPCPGRGPSHADGGPSASALGDVGKGVWPAKPRNDRPAIRGLDWRLQRVAFTFLVTF